VPIIEPSSAGLSLASVNLFEGGQGLIGETFDRGLVGGTATPSSGDMRGGAMVLRAGQTVTNLICSVGTGGTGMTHAQLALYDTSGNLLRNTADVAANFNSSGLKTTALTATYTATADAIVYAVVFLTTGTTMPQMHQYGTVTTFPLVAIGGGAMRSVSQGGLGALPNPATLVVNTPLFWIAAS
jgi:hypothetical protein